MLSKCFRFVRPLAGLLPVCLVISALALPAHGEVFTQIPGPFTPTMYQGDEFALSQNDVNAPSPFRTDFATIYDNFSFSSPLVVTGFSWIGSYEEANEPLANDFTLNIFSDNAGAPGTIFQSFSVGSASQSPLIGLDGFYSYETTLVTPFAVAANQDYWFSVIANQSYDINGWGVAFSSLSNGTSLSYQDFQEETGGVPDTDLTRYSHNIDYAFSVTAVPEPSTLLLLSSVGGVLAYRRRRNRV